MTPRPPAPRRTPPGSRPTDTSMPRPAPRRSIVAFAIILIVAVLISPASATEILSVNPSQYIDTGGQSIIGGSGQSPSTMGFTKIKLDDIEQARILNYIAFDVPGSYGGVHLEGKDEFMYSLPNGHTGEGVCYVDHSRNALNQITATRYTLFFYDWDIGALTGTQSVTINRAFATTRVYGGNLNLINDGDSFATLDFYSTVTVPVTPYISTVSAGAYWQNMLNVESIYDGLDYRINLQRVFDEKTYGSIITINGDIGTLHTSEDVKDISLIYPADSVTDISIENPAGSVYTYPIGSSGSPTNAVTVYIQNSQTGALLANANLAILAAAGGTETEVVNATLPGGTATYTLQPTGGGSPNPDYYRAVATVPGFSQIIENHSFTLNGPHDVIIEMRPDSGGPLDPERAYLEFYVRDLNANPIPAASIQCGGRILQTNSAGYAVFEVSKNATYPYVAKKSGYVTIEGTATVADGPRYVANVVLGPGTVPTLTPTLGPGETPGGPGATPTPDTRTNEQKGQAIIDLIADFAEPIALLAIVATVFGLMQMMMPRRR